MAIPKLVEGTQLQVGKHTVTITKYLSEGGFAQIYQVLLNNEPACLKRVIVPDKNGLIQLRKEVDVMKTLRKGRNIVSYIDSHAEKLENGSYQVLVLMELCPNGSLLDYMNLKMKTKLTETEILKIMLDISLGIYEMHKLKLIHRDIKIENVLIDSDHNFKLCDFGSTTGIIYPPQDHNQFAQLTNDILYQTTPQYRSPEMVDLYKGYPIDEKADIWALGCFLYKLCYYITPFETQGDIAILHASFQFPTLPNFSGDLKNLIIIMLQDNPLYRPNIIQVIMLVSKLMNIEYGGLKILDFYKTGAYNFQSLHEYQVQKQNETIRQKQKYMQQMNHKVEEEPENETENESLSGFSSDNDVSYTEKIEDAEQRYPSLENINKLDVSRNSSMKLENSSMKVDVSRNSSVKSKEPNDDTKKLADDIFNDGLVEDVDKLNISPNYYIEPINEEKVLNNQDFIKSERNLQEKYPEIAPKFEDFQNSYPKTESNLQEKYPEIKYPDRNIETQFSSDRKQEIYKPEMQYKPDTQYKPDFKQEPQYKTESHYKTEAQYKPEFKAESQYKPEYKPDSQYNKPDFIPPTVKENFTEPKNHNPWGEYKNETNLIDLDTSSTKPTKLEKPGFKKRLSSQNHIPINLQEEVIDFASDDENNNSDMNRIKIRNSLKKPPKSNRKSSDHNRSESSESKKRLSFLG
ncbi:unnamed protein product [Candida verbasci]|uniref:Protein kinase domain-containing protein n=1 Tax=Candida verbasci TaxID=1227364 RepID=A0A9W4TZA6_9ASCO|nr:unnamed protein product [Candida verbasci]